MAAPPVASMTTTTTTTTTPYIHAVVDSRGPHPFTTESVRATFRLKDTRHAHGKVVIQVIKE